MQVDEQDRARLVGVAADLVGTRVVGDDGLTHCPGPTPGLECEIAIPGAIRWPQVRASAEKGYPLRSG
jgi:hypothetical protein